MSKADDGPERRTLARDTLIRLANSCERAAARNKIVTPMAADLNEEDFRAIAEILRGLTLSLS